MKRIAWLLFCISLISILVFSVTILATAVDEKIENISVDHPGRYVLFQGEYQFVNLNGQEFWIRGLFKIDTATGKIFECRSSQFKDPETGKNIQYSSCYEVFKGEKLPIGNK